MSYLADTCSKQGHISILSITCLTVVTIKILFWETWKKYTVHREIFSPIFFFCPFYPRCQRVNLRLGEFQSLLFRLAKNVCESRRAKITHGENSPVYSSLTRSRYTILEKSIYFAREYK